MLDSTQLRNPKLFSKVVSADEAAAAIQDGMTLGFSGFTPAGYPKKVTLALAEQVRNGRKCKVSIYSGASLGPEVEEELAAVGAVNRRLPYYNATNKSMRKGINDSSIMYTDMHLSHVAEQLNFGFLGKVDIAIIEAVAITEEGHLILTNAVGNAPVLVKHAREVIVELNTAKSPKFEGVHDIYMQAKPPYRTPIPIYRASDRIGTTYVECGLDKIKFIVESDIQDSAKDMPAPDEKSERIAENLIRFLKDEIKAGRLPENLLPLQSGVGSIANAVLAGLKNSDFKNLGIYSEVLQPAVCDLIDAGKVKFASGTSFSLTPSVLKRFDADPDKYRSKIVLRPIDISNHPEVIRRLGLIALNTALEFDIYGHENSTHQMGTHMMNGIGGSGDFIRNAYLSIFTTESTAKDGEISRIVPMCSHVDSTEHDTQIFITEYGVADLRGLAPRERSRIIINNCAHPKFRDALLDYVERAEKEVGGHTPHLLEEALSWHINFRKYGTMVPQKQTVDKYSKVRRSN